MLKAATRTSEDFEIFCPLVKVDAKKREVWGVVTGEMPDKENEICDYATTVPYYKEVVDEMGKATDGANIFPLRAMHGLVAAGKGISIEFRPEAKEIYMGFKVVDDVEWKKVEENVYTGFSQGGRYVKRWKDGDYVRYTAAPVEVSLVDMPCYSRAHFDYVKADGTIEIRKFAKAGELPTNPQHPIVEDDGKAAVCKCSCNNCQAKKCSECQATEKCANFKSAAEKAVKYLVTESDGKTHLPYTDEDGKPNHRLMGAAWAALHGGYRGNKYEGPDKQKAIDKLKSVYEKEGLETPSEKSVRIDKMLNTMLTDVINNRAYGKLGKGMYSISRFSELMEDMKWLWMMLEYEREAEGDESPVTDDIHDCYVEMLDHLLTYVEEQVKEEKAHPGLSHGGA